ncbi:hypothetical protein P9302_08865 [Brevibacillus agri]|uniref:Uncharacterized protein n=1 Tax=Brevibacillus gelatini TaxID=1655277 RepID=A0A3M8B3A2_9BACL|nr:MULTISPECIES: hypothetical protein [Brevibacillus]MCG5254648.1 hypothetical protein [Brevibacillus agri]MED4569587.1 hypothetical protein [Brevibacillus agri]RNB57924.1 hypothetical protein EDM57_09420 [Brevibacillus gelatini]
MRWIDWIMVSLMIVIGLSCLTMSATWMASPDSIFAYVKTLFKICFWISVPVITAAIFYVLMKTKRNQDD